MGVSSLNDMCFLITDNLLSAAEISTGIICACLPTLAALGHPRRRQPSTSILNGKSYPRSPRSFGSHKPTGLDERYLFSTEFLASRELESESQFAVITAIRGGTATPRAMMEGVCAGGDRKTMDVTSCALSAGNGMDKDSTLVPEGGGIMKSFRIEQFRS